MDSQDFVSTRCASCDGKGLPGTLRPYCSVVCLTLGHAGLAWRTNPYRIIDIMSGAQVSAGPTFDLTTQGTAELQKHTDRLQEKAWTSSSEPWVRAASGLVLIQASKGLPGPVLNDQPERSIAVDGAAA